MMRVEQALFGVAVVLCLFAAGTKAAFATPARAGNLRALLDEARAYEHGEGVAKDPLRAVRLYCEGARRGNADAQYGLGWIYANGRGVPRDDGLAAYFFGLAARQGHDQARAMLPHVGPARKGDCMAAKEEGSRRDEVGGAPGPIRKKILDLVLRLAPEYGVNPDLALAVISAESNFDPLAVSSRNAQGVMQLIPETSARFNVAKPFDPEQNIRGGLAYLRWLLAYFQGNVDLVAAAYNAGEGAVNRFRGIPPFPETQGYVKRIKQIFRKDQHPYDRSITAPSPEITRIRTGRRARSRPLRVACRYRKHKKGGLPGHASARGYGG